MVNILPEEKRSKLTWEYRLRLVAVSLLFVSALFVVAILLFIPSYLLSRSRESAVVEQLSSLEKALALRDAKELDAELLDAKRKIDTLRSREKTSIRDIFELISSKRSPDVTIQSFVFQQGSSGKIIDISGEASSRESLFLFKRKLEHETSVFGSVNLPNSNFAKQSNINFSLNLKLVLPKTK